MKYDKFGRSYTDCNELVDLLYRDPELRLDKFFVLDTTEYNHAVTDLYAEEFPTLKQFKEVDNNLTIEEFDHALQANWHMPDEYKNMDIAQWLLDQCQTEPELQRVGEELLLYHDREMFPLLCYMKYMVDTFRTNNVVWGLGRGSSVASYVLYLIGVHKINSIYYDLPINEFLK
jgi:DNA polymerase III alpha subunit